MRPFVPRGHLRDAAARSEPRRYPGLIISLQPEIGSSSFPDSVEALERFLAPGDLEGPPLRNGTAPSPAWTTHRYEAAETFNTTYDHVYAYGEPRDLADWVSQAALAQVQQRAARAAVDVATGRGDAATATWIVRGEESRRRRGCDADALSRPARASGTNSSAKHSL